MKAYQLIKPFEFNRFEGTEAVQEGAAKIRITRADISSMDIYTYSGRAKNASYPIIPSRHAAGIVSESPEGSGLSRGTRVVIDPHFACGKCYACGTGATKNCENQQIFGIHADGFLRDFASVPLENIFDLPDQVKDNEAIFIEHISTAISVVQQLGVKQGEYIAIIGASTVGILLAQVALYYQAIPILIDAYQDRLDTAAQLGVYYTVNSGQENPVEKVLRLTAGRMCECVAYMSNSNEKIQRALECATFGGRISLVGWEIVEEIMSANISSCLTKRLTVFGMNMSYKNIAQSINLLANKKVSVLPLISEEIKFDDVPDFYKKMTESPYLYHKIVVSI